MSIESDERARVSSVARSWIGTPFADLGEVKGPTGGTDCGKLIKCVFIEAGLIDPFVVADYSPQHMHHSHEERFLGYVTRFLHEVPIDRVGPGDVVMYKVGRVYAHGAIVVDPGLPHIVHAWYRSRMVRRADYLEGELGDPKRAPRFFSRW